MDDIIYPTTEKITEYNLLSLELIKVKKKDQAKLLSYSKLRTIVDKCQEFEGDIYDKATFLFTQLIRQHPFASGNRRTAFIVTKDFLHQNNHKFAIQDDPSQARIMTGIREGFYSLEEVKEWLKHGKIREFTR